MTDISNSDSEQTNITELEIQYEENSDQIKSRVEEALAAKGEITGASIFIEDWTTTDPLDEIAGFKLEALPEKTYPLARQQGDLYKPGPGFTRYHAEIEKELLSPSGIAKVVADFKVFTDEQYNLHSLSEIANPMVEVHSEFGITKIKLPFVMPKSIG